MNQQVKEAKTPQEGAKTAQPKKTSEKVVTTVTKLKNQPKKEEKPTALERVEKLTAFTALAVKLEKAKDKKHLLEEFLNEADENQTGLRFVNGSSTSFATTNPELIMEAANVVLTRINGFISTTEEEIEAFEI